jgi:hypothetical protein
VLENIKKIYISSEQVEAAARSLGLFFSVSFLNLPVTSFNIALLLLDYNKAAITILGTSSILQG